MKNVYCCKYLEEEHFNVQNLVIEILSVKYCSHSQW